MYRITDIIKKNDLKSVIIIYDEYNKKYLNYILNYLSVNLSYKIISDFNEIGDKPFILVANNIDVSNPLHIRTYLKSECILSLSGDFIHVIKLRCSDDVSKTLNISSSYVLNKMLSSKIKIYD